METTVGLAARLQRMSEEQFERVHAAVAAEFRRRMQLLDDRDVEELEARSRERSPRR